MNINIPDGLKQGYDPVIVVPVDHPILAGVKFGRWVVCGTLNCSDEQVRWPIGAEPIPCPRCRKANWKTTVLAGLPAVADPEPIIKGES